MNANEQPEGQGNECCDITTPGHPPPCKLRSLKKFKNSWKKFQNQYAYQLYQFLLSREFQGKGIFSNELLTKECSLLTSMGKTEWLIAAGRNRSCFHFGAKEHTESGAALVRRKQERTVYTVNSLKVRIIKEVWIVEDKPAPFHSREKHHQISLSKSLEFSALLS